MAQGCSLWQLSSRLFHQGHFQDAEVPPVEALAMLKGNLDEVCNGVALSSSRDKPVFSQLQQHRAMQARHQGLQTFQKKLSEFCLPTAGPSVLGWPCWTRGLR